VGRSAVVIIYIMGWKNIGFSPITITNVISGFGRVGLGKI
jgi:hypothetical protein